MLLQSSSKWNLLYSFYGPNGDANSSSSGNNIPADIGLTDSKNFDKNQGSTVAAWDVTVRSSLTSTTDIKGRLFADYLALFTGNNGRPIYSKFYVVTKDGFRYESNLNGLDPNAFLIYGNDVGYYDSDGKSPLYHDVLGDNGNNSGSLSILKGSTNFALPTHTILFNNPQSSAGAMDVINIRGLPISPILPKIETLPNGDPIFKFIGNVSNNTSVINKGGNFIFDTNVLGSYEIIISKDGINFDPNKPENRQLRGLVTTTTGQTANWDGKDNSGNPFPVGTDYKAQIVIRNGEYHFPLIDAENSTLGGPSFTLLNAINSLGNKVGFYDDRGYKTLSGVNVGTPGQVLCGANPPNPALSDAINGFDTTGIGRKYGSNPGSNTNTSCTGSFGDAKGLDIWTYIPSQAAFSNVNIIAPSTPTAEKTVAIVEDNDKSGGTTPLANQTATPGDTLEYTIIVKNTSTTTPATTVVLTDNIPANTTYVPGSLQISAGENSGAKTDTNADDQADYDGTAKVVKFRLGLGANATKGGTLGITAADNTTTIKFRIKINDPIPAGVISVSNQAIISSDGNTDVKSNDPGTEDLPNDPTISKLGPRLRLVKRVTGIRKKKCDNHNRDRTLQQFSR
ncbi:MAG: DUF11 domain-containing protein [Methylacidiphilales bacterium]|nr:DUF11 domain-containing protein [Candidatus Methylacidiphilales bacterium]